MILDEWARKWGIPTEAVNDLRNMTGRMELSTSGAEDDKSEAWSQSKVVLDASRAGSLLWRNNVGVLVDKTGRPVRYGLCNENKKMNEKIKSSDLIGIRPVVIEPRHVGVLFGQFVAREVKKPGWRYNPNDAHEAAQSKFGDIVLAHGGDFSFTTGDF